MDAKHLSDGDVVALRNGERITVGNVFTSYTDASGTHEGPWVHAQGDFHSRYHVADIARVVTPNPNRCSLCGGGSTSGNHEAYPYCRSCHYTGAAEEHLRAEQLERLAKALGPAATVSVEHTGGGCFMLAVRYEGEDSYYMATDGDAALPSDDEGEPLYSGGWGFLARMDSEEDCEGEVLAEGDYDVLSQTLTLSDDALVALILTDRKGA